MIAVLSALGAPNSTAQVVDDREDRIPALKVVWGKILADADAVDRLTEMQTDEQRTKLYGELLRTFLQTKEVRDYLVLLPSDRRRYLGVDALLAGDQPALARSANAAATNPRRVGLLERSGITDIISSALQGGNLVSADDTAVTINLSAAALLCSTCRDGKFPSATRYRAGGALNRIGGSLTFGAKIPEKEIVGFSGLPATDALFDVVVWDVKLRLIGDRDPRAGDWDDEILGELGGLENLRAMALGATSLAFPIDPKDPDRTKALVAPLGAAFTPVITQRTTAVADTIRRSLQVSVKFSGQHLTTQAGMNKYTGVLMADKGFGRLDGSLNVSYSAVQDVKIQPDVPVTLKQWRVAAGFVGPIWKNVFVTNRSAELALSGEGVFPADGSEVPVDRRTTYKADLALKIPISESLELPFSVTYTNDPNELAKKSYVTGRVGVTYDFGALKRLAQGK
jgi:hypothetical protein